MTHNKTTAAIEKNVQAEENLQSSANKTASAEQKVADSLNKSEQEAKEYGAAMIKAADDSEKLGDKGGNAISELESIIAGAGIVMGLKKSAKRFLIEVIQRHSLRQVLQRFPQLPIQVRFP